MKHDKQTGTHLTECHKVLRIAVQQPLHTLCHSRPKVYRVPHHHHIVLPEQLLKLAQNASCWQHSVSVLGSDKCPVCETVGCCCLVLHKGLCMRANECRSKFWTLLRCVFS